MICHSASSTATSSSQGDQRSTCFMFMARSLPYGGDGGASLAQRADVAAQLVHDVGELGV
jgi:hypothetical protein